MSDQVYTTNSKNLFCSVVILFLCFEGLYESLFKAFFRCALDPVYTVPGQFCTVRKCLHCRGSKFSRLAVPFKLYRYDLNSMVEHCLKEAIFHQLRQSRLGLRDNKK